MKPAQIHPSPSAAYDCTWICGKYCQAMITGASRNVLDSSVGCCKLLRPLRLDPNISPKVSMFRSCTRQQTVRRDQCTMIADRMTCASMNSLYAVLFQLHDLHVALHVRVWQIFSFDLKSCLWWSEHLQWRIFVAVGNWTLLFLLLCRWFTYWTHKRTHVFSTTLLIVWPVSFIGLSGSVQEL